MPVAALIASISKTISLPLPAYQSQHTMQNSEAAQFTAFLPPYFRAAEMGRVGEGQPVAETNGQIRVQESSAKHRAPSP